MARNTMGPIQICINHRNTDFILYIDEFDYSPGYEGKGPSMSDPGEPGYGPSVEVVDGNVEVDVFYTSKIQRDIDKQLNESGRLFWILVNEHSDYVEQYLLESEECYMDDCDDLGSDPIQPWGD